MADSNIPHNVVLTHSYSGGMVRDLLDQYIKENSWYYARNATTVLPDGGIGGIHTEPSNIRCVDIPYVLIGAIPMTGSDWALFFTDDTNHEIGVFNETNCIYSTLTGVQSCLNFNKKNLITGAARRGYDCGYDVYWADGARNPDRFINTAKVPWVQVCTTTSACITCVDTTVLDCDKLRIAPIFSVPCLKLANAQGSGLLKNGSYQVCIAYTINGLRCTDYIALSNVVGTWSHLEGGAINLSISGAETSVFDEMEVVLISLINSNASARRLGLYSTRQRNIYIDNIDLTLTPVPLELIPVSTPAIEKSDSICSISNYLIRLGVYTRPDFNYQPLANQIVTRWAAVLYPDDYYHKGGNSFGMEVSYLRGEVYAYYIRWRYTTGDVSADYNIPGRVATAGPTLTIGGPSVPGSLGTIASGLMQGYESTELYPDDQPLVWGALCGQRIRHHKFPDQASFGAATTIMSHFNPNGTQFTISVMGVYFENIQLPVDNNGVLIPDIQGYEILRASREGNKSILAKGMVNHMRGYRNADGSIGLYQNYPYDDLHRDRYLTSSQTIGTVGGTVDGWQNNELNIVSDTIVSFHSPDTVFRNPVLGNGNMVLPMAMAGVAEGNFLKSYKHPKFKLLTDQASALSAIIAAISTISSILNSFTGNQSMIASTEDLPVGTPLSFQDIPDGTLGALSTIAYPIAIAAQVTLTVAMAPLQFKVIQQQVLNIINGLVPGADYTWQYNSHGYYDTPVMSTRFNTTVDDYQYIYDNVQEFKGQTVNNLYRNDYVAVSGVPLPDFPIPYNFVDVPAVYQNYNSVIVWSGYGSLSPLLKSDYSRFTLGQGPSSPYPPGQRDIIGPFQSPVVSWYGAYTVPQAAQYGQIDSTRHIPIGCMQSVSTITNAGLLTSQVLFGGDTYICRYTEQNPMLFFNDWLVDAPSDFQYDYTNYENVPYPRYWINNSKVYYDFWATASRNWHLDELPSIGPFDFWVKGGGYMYLFNSGVRDFYVETEINIGYRDWDEDRRFYDPYGYTNIDYLFRSDLIKNNVLYKYDYSLSASRFLNQYISWGQCLRRDYDPLLAYTCFAYYPRRLHYSLPQSEELRRDNWRLFLANNYTNFNSKVTTIKDIHKTGALILMDDDVPQLLPGVESIPSHSGTEFSTGSGLLFAQTLQNVSNVDQSYQYGSCQSRMGVINTPHGLFWISQRAGKIFQYTGQGLEDISRYGMKMWLSLYLPSQLIQQFPLYPLQDNPVAGVGCQMVYDTVNEIVYICKRDYKVRNQFIDTVRYNVNKEIFEYLMDSGAESIPIPIQLGDSTYFEDCSWTLSYSPVNKQFISFHDWKPSYCIPAKNHFLTTVATPGTNILWRHNQTTGTFCIYYGTQYPFAVETALSGGDVQTIESIEYLMQSSVYQNNQVDKFNQYAQGFDRALVINSEQSTLFMDMTLQPWNDPFASLNYPNVSLTGTFNTLYSRVENRYRLSSIYDFTADRGQFTLSTVQAIQTDNNGYTFNLNTLYIDPAKVQQQRKKIRHYNNRVYLQKNQPFNSSMSLYSMTINTTKSYR